MVELMVVLVWKLGLELPNKEPKQFPISEPELFKSLYLALVKKAFKSTTNGLLFSLIWIPPTFIYNYKSSGVKARKKKEEKPVA